MSVYDRDFTKMDARAIARECSPVHIENVLQAAFDEIALLRREKNVAAMMMRGLKSEAADPSWNGAIDECIEALN
jgi:hypothetical protein